MLAPRTWSSSAPRVRGWSQSAIGAPPLALRTARYAYSPPTTIASSAGAASGKRAPRYSRTTSSTATTGPIHRNETWVPRPRPHTTVRPSPAEAPPPLATRSTSSAAAAISAMVGA